MCVVSHIPFSACGKPNAEIVDHLLKYGASVHKACVQGMTPLHEAAGHDNVEICQMLLNAGAKLNAANIYGIDPFFTAAQNGRVEVLSFLISKGKVFEFWQPTSRLFELIILNKQYHFIHPQIMSIMSKVMQQVMHDKPLLNTLLGMHDPLWLWTAQCLWWTHTIVDPLNSPNGMTMKSYNPNWTWKWLLCPNPIGFPSIGCLHLEESIPFLTTPWIDSKITIKHPDDLLLVVLQCCHFSSISTLYSFWLFSCVL